MPAFDYVAISVDGRTLSGRIEAADAGAAARRLQQAGSLPVELRPAGEARAAAARGPAPLPAREVARLTRSLALLLAARLPLDAALAALAEAEARRPARTLLRGLLDALRGGLPFAGAVAGQAGAFPGWYVAAVAAAEGTGRLPEVLEMLAAEMLRTARTADRLRAGLTYPAVVLALAGVAVAVLVAVVLPALEPLLAAGGGPLPASTRIVLAAGAALRDWGAPALVLLLAAGLVARRAAASPGGRRWLDARLLGAPLVGAILWRAATARVARVLGALLSAGVPLTEALGHAAGAAGNAAVGARIEEARALVVAGARLAAALAQEAALPRLAVTLAGIGDEGGRLKDMMQEIATIHEEDLDRAVDRLVALLVPGVTLLLGGLVAGIVLATLDAILAANGAALAGR